MDVIIHGPKKAAAFTTYIDLRAQSDDSIQTSPTIASGDFKVSQDGGAIANPNTLPAESPASSGIVKVVLDSGEMNADVVILKWHDVAGAQWKDGMLVINTRAVTVDELVRSTTPANSLDVASSGEAGCDLSNAKLPGSPTTFTNVIVPEVGQVDNLLAISPGALDSSIWGGTAIAAANINSDVYAALWAALTSGLTTSGSVGKFLLDNINALVAKMGNTGVTSNHNTLDEKLTALANAAANHPTDFGAFDGTISSLGALAAVINTISDTHDLCEGINTIGGIVTQDVIGLLYKLTVNQGSSLDEWRVVWTVNGVPTAVTSSSIKVIKDDATNLIATTAMTAIPGTPGWKYDAASVSRISSGSAYQVVFSCVYNTQPYEIRAFVGRDA